MEKNTKNYLDWLIFAYAGGLGYPIGTPPVLDRLASVWALSVLG